MEKEKKSRKLNEFTEKKNEQPPVEVEKKVEEKVEEAEVISETNLPETKSIVPIKEFSMPIADPEQLERYMDLYQKCVNSLVKSRDIVMVEGKPHGKKIAINKINRVMGVSTEPIRSFMEEQIAHKDFWSKGYNKVVLVHRGEKYFVAKAWVKAILPNGQFCTRGAAVSETERRFAHFPHDLLATAETRAMKNAAVNLLGVEFEMVDEEEGQSEKAQAKTYKPKPNAESGYKKSAISNPKMEATTKQKDYIRSMRDRLESKYGIKTEMEKEINDMNKGEAADIIEKLLKRGKDAAKEAK